VLGIAESGLLTALTLGERVGIIAILATSIPRHGRFVRALGIESRLAGELPIGLGVSELAQEEVTLGRMAEVGGRLRDEHGADVLVMGCAGMARYRARLEASLGLPVVDPTQAAVGMALTAARLGYRTAAQRGPATGM
jgi:Asp/Glu/hydantoin racemase